jgi:ABC-type antimicrobial peptide transport system permease subunit
MRRAQSYRAILRLGAQLLAAGAGVGLVASFATNQLVASQLSTISPHDPLTLAAGTLLVSLIALAACYIPARRASLVDCICEN